MTMIVTVLNASVGFVETWSRGLVLAMAILPSLAGILCYYGMRLTKLASYRAVSLAPIGFGVLLGLAVLQDLSRPGVREYGDVGFRASLLYLSIVVVPFIAAGFLALRELKERRSDLRRVTR